MLLTRKSDALGAGSASPLVHSLRRGLSQALPTMDRRAFLRRSGLGVGVGLAASQLTLVKKSQAASGHVAVGEGKIESEALGSDHLQGFIDEDLDLLSKHMAQWMLDKMNVNMHGITTWP